MATVSPDKKTALPAVVSAGYDRFEGLEEQALPAALYKPLVPPLNFFMPAQKLKSKTRARFQRNQGLRRAKEPVRQAHRKCGAASALQGHPQCPCAFYNPVELQRNASKAILRLRAVRPVKPYSEAGERIA
jgi:hypothetical protein